MISKRKTIRFQDNLTDMSVYEAISNYRKYGYRSESHMVIDAVYHFLKNDNDDLQAERLADFIAKRLSGKLIASKDIAPASLPTDDSTAEEAAFDAALSFLDSL